ncbi:MAG: tyrosine-type recombinase/integrase [Anaerolineales bacterium]|nr:tyrosine-type recombinase/integrase [Anaerolineales bacterium]
MNRKTTALIPQHDWYTIIDLVTQSVDSPHSKRAYSRALIDFLDWYDSNGRPGFTKATINAYREEMLQSGKSRSSINQALSAIRKLAAEAADNGLVPPTLAYGVERVKGVKQEGVRAGNWLTKEEAEQLINTPVTRWRQEEIPLRKAIRDQAILAVMIGTGLRRSEVAGLTWAMLQQRDGRWAIIDLMGKRGRVRSVGIPPWVKVALDRWGQTAGQRDGRIFLALNKDGSLAGVVRTKGGTRTDGFLTPQAIYNVVKEHVLAAGHYNRKGEAALAAHDLRRTAAALALKGGADLRQIQQMLGHASITTTERYLEPMRSLQVTAGDFIQIELALTTQ